MSEVKTLRGGAAELTQDQKAVLSLLSEIRERVVKGEIIGVCAFLTALDGTVEDSEVAGVIDVPSLHISLHTCMIDLASVDNNDA